VTRAVQGCGGRAWHAGRTPLSSAKRRSIAFFSARILRSLPRDAAAATLAADIVVDGSPAHTQTQSRRSEAAIAVAVALEHTLRAALCLALHAVVCGVSHAPLGGGGGAPPGNMLPVTLGCTAITAPSSQQRRHHDNTDATTAQSLQDRSSPATQHGRHHEQRHQP
jgi:hypothetical protein